MKAYVFPGQGAQFTGMGQDMYTDHELAREFFEQANEILGYRLSDVMFSGDEEALRATKITQPAIFLHSVIKVMLAGTDFQPAGVAGHSLGEFSALVAVGAIAFEDGLRLVHARALAMQEACELQPGTMAAVLGLDDQLVEDICAAITDVVVVPANYNTPGQLVISGSLEGVGRAAEQLTAAGATKVVELVVGGAFHSPLMQPAQDKLAAAIEATAFRNPRCPIYQNVDASPHIDPVTIQQNLVKQLTGPVRWTQTVQQMAQDGYDTFTEVGGKGSILRGLIRRIDRSLATDSL
ncbi:MAG: [acyl-carrier-protein] S-malonyltransferase [Bacteroidetes bacterium]|nr:MAG: [acyl-carrier-protein] S-malonyltransferase [Bacteroidota bacterium]PTM14281.1 MAG: [acyl-carrier-protein] S-malonyltransferase [Bacteroidota bacterium]